MILPARIFVIGLIKFYIDIVEKESVQRNATIF